MMAVWRGKCILCCFVIASKCECMKTTHYASLLNNSNIPNHSMVICLLASSYLRLGWINVGMENIPNCCFSVSWLQLSGVKGIQFLREIQAEGNEWNSGAFVCVHSPGCPLNYHPHYEMPLKKSRPAITSELLPKPVFAALFECRWGSTVIVCFCCSVICSLYLVFPLSLSC